MRNLSVYLSICRSVYLYTCLSVHLSIYIFICLRVFVSVGMCVCVSIWEDRKRDGRIRMAKTVAAANGCLSRLPQFNEIHTQIEMVGFDRVIELSPMNQQRKLR